MGLFDNVDPDATMQIGLGLLANGDRNLAGQGGIGHALQGAMQGYYGQKQAKMDLVMNRLKMQQMLQEMPLRMQYLQGMAGDLGMGGQPAQGDPSQGAATAQPTGLSPPGAPMSAPQGAPPVQGQIPPMGQMPQGGGLDPMRLLRRGMFGGALGMPGADTLVKGADTMLHYDPDTTTRMKVAESPVTVDMAQIQAALGQGNSPLAAQLYQKLQMDLKALQVSERNGVVTKVGPTGNVDSYNPEFGTHMALGANGSAGTSLIPGMSGAIQQKAAAESVGKSTGEVGDYSDAAGNVRQTSKLDLLQHPGSLSAIGPGTTSMLRNQSDTANQTFKETQAQADASNLQLAQIGDLRGAALDFTPGKFANGRGEMLDFMNSAGLISPTQAKELGSKQAGDKISIQLQSAATKALGSREAAQVFGAMGKSIPNLTMSANGLEKVASFMEGMARYNIARAQEVQRRYNAGDANGVNAVKDEFYNKSNPTYYILGSASPAVRQELLSSIPNKAKFLAGWAEAYKAGMAPAPGDYR